MSNDLSDIVEVVKTNTHGANLLLQAGYRLLEVSSEQVGIMARNGGVTNGRNFWVDRYISYVLGRPAGIAPVVPPKGHREGLVKFAVIEEEASA